MEDWMLYPGEDSQGSFFVLKGKVYGSPFYSDGEEIVTSPLASRLGGIVCTVSGTRYYLGKPRAVPDEFGFYPLELSELEGKDPFWIREKILEFYGFREDSLSGASAHFFGNSGSESRFVPRTYQTSRIVDEISSFASV